jgi:hypothetical protein
MMVNHIANKKSTQAELLIFIPDDKIGWKLNNLKLLLLASVLLLRLFSKT